MGFNWLKATQPLRGDSLLFTRFLVLTLSTSQGWKAGLTLEPPNGFEFGTPGLGIHYFNNQAIAPYKR